MKIAVVQNRFANLDWPDIEWLDGQMAVDLGPGEWDFFLFLGLNVELLHHPDQLIRFRANERIGVLIEGPSIHEYLADHPAPLGMEKFRDDFWVLKAGPYAQDFLSLWREQGGSIGAVTDIVWKLGVMPIIYPPMIVSVHCDEASQPNIVWGEA